MDKVVHFEIPFDDQQRAESFYKNSFGWKINAAPGMPYWIVHTIDTDEQMMPKESGAINGGMYKREGDGARTPVIVINVTNVEEALKKIEEAGGKTILPKRQVGDMGIYAQFQDSEGNILGIWQPLKNK
jgi:uncharacterized protein